MDKLTLCRVFWRSLFLQASWNYNGQQNLGFSAALFPGLEKIYGPDGPGLNAALARSLKPFNTQPYMGGPLLGALVKAEELGPEGGFAPERIERLKSALMSAFAAIGDAFFWNALLPAAAVVGMFWAIQGRMFGMIVFLVLLNLVHLVFRVGGFCLGYRYGLGIVSVMDRLALPAQALRIRLFSAGMMGLLAAWILARGSPRDWSGAHVLAVGLAAGFLIYVLAGPLSRRLPVEALIYGLFAVLLAWTHFVV